MWSTEIQHVLWKACKNFDNFFFYIFLIFFGNSDETKQGEKLMKKFQEAAEKISDFSDKRAKSYACFTEGISRYVFREAQHSGGS